MRARARVCGRCKRGARGMQKRSVNNAHGAVACRGVRRELMKRHSISIPSKCPKSKTLVKLGAILDTPYDSSDDVDVTKYMAKYTLADLAFVLKHVDGRLEHLLGYNYESERQWAISQFGKDAVAKLFWLV